MKERDEESQCLIEEFRENWNV